MVFNDTAYNARWIGQKEYTTPIIGGYLYKFEIVVTPLAEKEIQIGLWDLGGINKLTQVFTDATINKQTLSSLFYAKTNANNEGFDLFNHTYTSDNSCGITIHSMKIEWYGMWK